MKSCQVFGVIFYFDYILLAGYNHRDLEKKKKLWPSVSINYMEMRGMHACTTFVLKKAQKLCPLDHVNVTMLLRFPNFLLMQLQVYILLTN